MRSAFYLHQLMNRVIYFNITYKCNLDCVFCFSNSTSPNGKVMGLSAIFDSLLKLKPEKSDLIVLNGGEPTLHPEFYNILYTIQSNFPSAIAIYSNGSRLITSKLQISTETFFIIPIHGYEKQHDLITQTKGSFAHTIRNLHSLNVQNCRYKLKFIINDLMIKDHFVIKNFINKYHLTPEEIILARLNCTEKSKKNRVIIPRQEQYMPYFQEQLLDLKYNYKIKLLDIPPCQISGDIKMSDNVPIPTFYFNDPNNRLQIRSYYKDIVIDSQCPKCDQYKICKLLQNSYLTLSFYNDMLMLERE